MRPYLIDEVEAAGCRAAVDPPTALPLTVIVAADAPDDVLVVGPAS